MVVFLKVQAAVKSSEEQGRLQHKVSWSTFTCLTYKLPCSVLSYVLGNTEQWDNQEKAWKPAMVSITHADGRLHFTQI